MPSTALCAKDTSVNRQRPCPQDTCILTREIAQNESINRGTADWDICMH